MSSKELFNTDKENIPNNILPIIGEPVTEAKIVLDAKIKPKKLSTKVTDYHFKKNQILELKAENARLLALLSKPVITESIVISKVSEPVKIPEPVKTPEPVKMVTTIEEIIKVMKPVKGKFW